MHLGLKIQGIMRFYSFLEKSVARYTLVSSRFPQLGWSPYIVTETKCGLPGPP